MRGNAGIVFVALGLLILYVAISGKYDCFVSFASCLLEVPLANTSPGGGKAFAGATAGAAAGNGFLGGFQFPSIGGGGGFGTPPTFGGGFGGFGGFGDIGGFGGFGGFGSDMGGFGGLQRKVK